MTKSLRYTKGAGNAAIYLRVKNAGQYWNFSTLAWVAAEAVATKAFLTEYADAGDAAESDFEVSFTPPPAGPWKIEIVVDATGATIAVGDTEETAKESTLLALGVTVATLPTLAEIIAVGGVGGIITGVVDAGVTVSSSFNPITMEKGEKKVIAYQIKENGVAIDVSAYTFTFGVKRDLYDTVYAFAAVAGVISADDDGVLSIVTFIIPPASTKALAVIESGRYSVGMYDGVGNKVALTPPGGVSFRLTEDILDVA